MGIEEGKHMLKDDIRIQTLIDWLMKRYEPLDLEYKIATTFSLGILI